MTTLSLEDLISRRRGDYGDLIDAVEGWCYKLSEWTGLGLGTNPPEIYWFRRPIIHIVEFVVYHLFVLLLWWLTKGYYRRMSRGLKVPRAELPDSAIDKLLGLAFLFIFISQAVFKSLRPAPFVQIWWLIMPCHLITLGWAFILTSKKKGNEKNRKFALYLASVMSACHWGPGGAAALPDTSDHQYPIETMIFHIHHGLLVLMPFYWATRYRFIPMTEEFFVHVTMLATWINVGPYMVVSYLTGLNVNYMLAPPKGLRKMVPLIWDTEAYRVYTILGLIFLTVVLRASIGACGVVLRSILTAVGIMSQPEPATAERPTGAAGKRPPAKPKEPAEEDEGNEREESTSLPTSPVPTSAAAFRSARPKRQKSD